jgi:GNAT superfamily N-acetyltransferase
MIDYIDSLQRKNAECLAFYPRQVFERERERGRLFLAMLNNEPCGYIYAGAKAQDVKCHQVCIQYDARRRLYGAHLVGAVENYAVDGRAASITLRCGFDLEANNFWKTLGYNVIAIRDGGVRRMRKINIWRKQLSPELFETVFLEPAIGTTNASIWRRNKDTSSSLVTQFVRGKQLDQYRAKLIAMEGKK